MIRLLTVCALLALPCLGQLPILVGPNMTPLQKGDKLTRGTKYWVNYTPPPDCTLVTSITYYRYDDRGQIILPPHRRTFDWICPSYKIGTVSFRVGYQCPPENRIVWVSTSYHKVR